MEIKKELGFRISNALSCRGKKQKELAEAIGVTANTISYFCSGSRTPNIEQLIKISDYLNVTTDYLLGRTNDPNIVPSAIDQLGISESVSTWLQSLEKESSTDNVFSDDINHVLENSRFRSLVFKLREYEDSLKARKIYTYTSRKMYEIHGDNPTHYRNILWAKIEKMIKSNIYSNTICKCLAGEFYVSEAGVYDKLNKITATILRDGLISDFSEIYASHISRDFTLFLASIEEEIKYKPIQDITPNYDEFSKIIADSE